jgi:hypothetical protein
MIARRLCGSACPAFIFFLRLPSGAGSKLFSTYRHQKDTTMNIKFIAVILCAAVSSNALADEHCTYEPRSKWLTTADMKARIEQQGMVVQRIETDDGCYEVHATRKNGDRVKLTLHPISAAVVQEEIKYAQPTSAGPVAPDVR